MRMMIARRHDRPRTVLSGITVNAHIVRDDLAMELLASTQTQPLLASIAHTAMRPVKCGFISLPAYFRFPYPSVL